MNKNSARVTPELKQMFFIGSGAGRTFVVPRGATRLALGVMDGYEWNNNEGRFRVTIHLEREQISSSLRFEDWACMAGRDLCTPGTAQVRELGGGRYHVILPAHLEWPASIPARPGLRAQVANAKGTVCMQRACGGPDGNSEPRAADALVADQPLGSLVTKAAGDRVYFSVNGRASQFSAQQGYFEFEVHWQER